MEAQSTRVVRRLHWLTAIRFFAAIYVVLYHFSGAVVPYWRRIGSGYLGVDLFFVLSGFILMYIYGPEVTTQREFYRRFLSARIARIYPVFLFAFALAGPSAIGYEFYRRPPVEAAAKCVAAAVGTLSLIHAWFPRIASFWNFPSWSVSDEAFFYLCFPFLAVQVKRFTERQSLLLALVCTVLAPGFLAFALGKPDNAAIEYIPILRLSEFVLGLAVGQIFLLRQHRPSLPGIWAVLAGVLTVCTAGALGSIPYFPRVFMATPVFGLLIYALARAERPSQDQRLPLGGLVLLGDASYSIYILQWPLFFFCGLSVTAMTPWKLLSYLVLLTGVSVLSFKYLETPLRRKVLARLTRKGPAAKEPPILAPTNA